jgi:hypothetical protein
MRCVHANESPVLCEQHSTVEVTEDDPDLPHNTDVGERVPLVTYEEAFSGAQVSSQILCSFPQLHAYYCVG